MGARSEAAGLTRGRRRPAWLGARRALQVELSTLGGIKTLPYLVMFLMSNVGGWVGDWLILTHKYSVAAGRKTVNTLGAGLHIALPGAARRAEIVHGACARHARAAGPDRVSGSASLDSSPPLPCTPCTQASSRRRGR